MITVDRWIGHSKVHIGAVYFISVPDVIALTSGLDLWATLCDFTYLSKQVCFLDDFKTIHWEWGENIRISILPSVSYSKKQISLDTLSVWIDTSQVSCDTKGRMDISQRAASKCYHDLQFISCSWLNEFMVYII